MRAAGYWAGGAAYLAGLGRQNRLRTTTTPSERQPSTLPHIVARAVRHLVSGRIRGSPMPGSSVRQSTSPQSGSHLSPKPGSARRLPLPLLGAEVDVHGAE